LVEVLGVVVGVVGHSRREGEGEGGSGTISIATARPPVQINRWSFRARLRKSISKRPPSFLENEFPLD
jgi:stress response protein SCP2